MKVYIALYYTTLVLLIIAVITYFVVHKDVEQKLIDGQKQLDDNNDEDIDKQLMDLADTLDNIPKKYMNYVGLPDIELSETLVVRNDQFISNIIIINLNESKDRWNTIYPMVRKYFPQSTIYRLHAIRQFEKGVGILKSHLLAIQTAKKLPGLSLIMEDDFEFNMDKNKCDIVWSDVHHVFKNRAADVFIASPYIKSWKKFDSLQKYIPYDNNIKRTYRQIMFCTTASAYCVNRDFMDTFIDHYKEVLEKSKIHFSNIHYNDQVWIFLQTQYRFFSLDKTMGVQIPGKTTFGDLTDNSFHIKNHDIIHYNNQDHAITNLDNIY